MYKKLIFLHTTCCYFIDNIHLNAELEKYLNMNNIDTIHLLTGGGICTYFSLIEEPKTTNCYNNKRTALNYLENTKKKTLILDTYCYNNKRTALNYLENTKKKTLILDTYTKRIDFDIINNFEESLKNYSFENSIFEKFNIWEIIKGSVSSYLQWDSVLEGLKNVKNFEVEIINQFIISSVRYILAFRNLYNEIKPTHILIFNGMFYLERIAYEIAKEFNISVIATESTCFFDRKHFDLSGVIGNRHSFGFNSEHYIETKVINTEQKNTLYKYLNNIYSGKNNTIKQKKTSNEDVRRSLGIPRSKKLITFLGQVSHDSVIVYDSPIYSSIYECILDTIKIFENKKEFHLIIRLHPGGKNTSMKKDLVLEKLLKHNLPKNVSIVHSLQLNTYNIIKESLLGITISSQAGLEMLSMHKPLVVLGKAFYSNIGVTFNVTISTVQSFEE